MRISLTLSLLLLSQLVICQILDDSTELVYGTKTIEVFYESDLLMNTEDGHALDTSVSKLEMVSFVDRNGRRFQDLGNIGTAMFPVFYDLPKSIGQRSGFSAYDPIIATPGIMEYYDTKSPFIDIFVLFGGKGRSLADFKYSQNVKPNWNIGFDYKRIITDKQIGAEITEGDRNVVSTSFDFFTYYKHSTIPYQVLFNVISMNHKVDEAGGIFIPDSVIRELKFQYQDNPINLQDARNTDKRLNFHMYQEYGLFKKFQFYHKFDREKQTNTYTDFNETNASLNYRNYYDQFLIDSDSTYEKSVFTSLSNEIGLKGSISAVYYRFYAKNRIVDHSMLYDDPNKKEIENYIGGITQFTWKDHFNVRGEAEFLHSGEYYFKGSLGSKLINASYTSMRYKQINLTNRYFGNHKQWSNSFDQGFANQLEGSINLKWKGQLFKPLISLTTLNNFTYFDSYKTPRLAKDPALISRIGGDLNLYIQTNRSQGYGFHIDNEVYYTPVTGNSSDYIRIPELFYNGRIYWAGNWFKKTVPLEIGIGIHKKSDYYANAYDPVLQQFYLQNDIEVNRALAIDVFWNMRIEKIWLFIKVSHVNQPLHYGYYSTPLYPAQQLSADFGVKWLFFD